MNSVRPERTGWRDRALSARHRDWGFDCPAADVDFIMIEYERCKPVALVEYKERSAPAVDVTNNANLLALIALAGGYRPGPLPCMLVRYCSDGWWFTLQPLNEPAERHYAHVIGVPLSEQRFVRSLYLLRKKALSSEDEKVIAGLNTYAPEGDKA